jgi:hypothetical protein
MHRKSCIRGGKMCHTIVERKQIVVNGRRNRPTAGAKFWLRGKGRELPHLATRGVTLKRCGKVLGLIGDAEGRHDGEATKAGN